MKLIHLSDLHVSTRNSREYGHLRTIVAHIVEHHRDAVVAITGDLVNHGRRREFDCVVGLLGPLETHCRLLLLMPGNHDVEWAGSFGCVNRQHFRECRRGLTRVSAGYPYCMEIDGVQLTCLDTTAAAGGAEDLARGQVGYRQWIELSRYLEIGEPHTRVVLGHHHLFERGLGLELVDAEEVRAVCSSRCDLYLMGHRHTWDAWSDVYGIERVFAADKTTSPTDGELRFRVFDITADSLTWTTETLEA